MGMEQIEVNDSVVAKDITESVRSTDSISSVEMDTGKILGLIPVFLLLLIMFVRLMFVIYKSNGQKTRNSQQRRTYMGSRQRPSDTQSEPTVYVSPANLPPPPKYEAMAPPSYEEVVGIHYPGFQAPVQPITQPITTALAQSSNSTTENENTTNNASRRDDTAPASTVITVTSDARPPVAVTAS